MINIKIVLKYIKKIPFYLRLGYTRFFKGIKILYNKIFSNTIFQSNNANSSNYYTNRNTLNEPIITNVTNSSTLDNMYNIL